jgi:hypothetical protein
VAEPKVGPSDLVERLKAAGQMPTLEQVLAAAAEVRAEYRPRILAARKRRTKAR